MKKLLLVFWIVLILGFTGYKIYEHIEREKALERSRSPHLQEKADDITTSAEIEKPEHTVIQSSDRLFTGQKKVYTNEDIRKLNGKKKKKGVITNEEIKKYHK